MSSRAEGVAPADDALGLFMEPTALHAEHERLMQVRGRAIPWEASTAATLPAHLREGLGEIWQARMVSEHRSVGICSLYVLDLLGVGAPAEYVSLACRASLDEVRHAQLFARLAGLYVDTVDAPPPGIPRMDDDPAVSLREQVAAEAMHLSVFAETYSQVLLTGLYDAATDPVVRAVLGSVIADEVYHARMGWALLRWLVNDHADGPRLRATLQAAVLPTVDSIVQTMFGDTTRIAPSSVADGERALAEAHGYMSGRDEFALFVATIRDVWIPGLAALGLDGRALEGRYPAPRDG